LFGGCTGCLVNYAELAREAGMSPTTARRYLEFLRMTCQAMLLPPYLGNLTSRIVTSPKLYWTDLGLLRHATRQWGPIGGHQSPDFIWSFMFCLISR
jgi:predicted AAA+ superfamily ATPase